MNVISPTLKQLRYLIALEQTGSFSDAAELCLVTQSTLSLGIKDLEHILEQSVVDRSSRKAKLTPFGQSIADKAKSIMAVVDEIMTLANLSNEPLSGIIRLGVIPTIAPYFLPKILSPLTQKFPNLELQLHEDLTARLLEKLQKGQIDIALMAFPFETPGMKQYILFEEPFFLASNKPQNVQRLSLNALEDQNILLLEDGHCLRDHALQACKLASPAQRKTFSATSLPTLIQMVQHGFGVTLLPEMACQSAALPKGIALTPFTSPEPQRQIGLAWMDNPYRAAEFELLADSIKELQNS